MKSWMFDFNTVENAATFIAQVCWTCQRFWDTSKVPEAQPICLRNSVGWNYIINEVNQGHTPEYDLPVWDPTDCGAYMSK